MRAFSYVRVTWQGGGVRVYDLVTYCLLPSATLLGTRVEFVTRVEAIAAKAAEAGGR